MPIKLVTGSCLPSDVQNHGFVRNFSCLFFSQFSNGSSSRPSHGSQKKFQRPDRILNFLGLPWLGRELEPFENMKKCKYDNPCFWTSLASPKTHPRSKKSLQNSTSNAVPKPFRKHKKNVISKTTTHENKTGGIGR